MASPEAGCLIHGGDMIYEWLLMVTLQFNNPYSTQMLGDRALFISTFPTQKACEDAREYLAYKFDTKRIINYCMPSRKYN